MAEHPDARLDGWEPEWEVEYVIEVLTWWRALRQMQNWSADDSRLMHNFESTERLYRALGACSEESDGG